MNREYYEMKMTGTDVPTGKRGGSIVAPILIQRNGGLNPEPIKISDTTMKLQGDVVPEVPPVEQDLTDPAYKPSPDYAKYIIGVVAAAIIIYLVKKVF